MAKTAADYEREAILCLQLAALRMEGRNYGEAERLIEEAKSAIDNARICNTKGQVSNG